MYSAGGWSIGAGVALSTLEPVAVVDAAVVVDAVVVLEDAVLLPKLNADADVVAGAVVVVDVVVESAVELDAMVLATNEKPDGAVAAVGFAVSSSLLAPPNENEGAGLAASSGLLVVADTPNDPKEDVVAAGAFAASSTVFAAPPKLNPVDADGAAVVVESAAFFGELGLNENALDVDVAGADEPNENDVPVDAGLAALTALAPSENPPAPVAGTAAGAPNENVLPGEAAGAAAAGAAVLPKLKPPVLAGAAVVDVLLEVAAGAVVVLDPNENPPPLPVEGAAAVVPVDPKEKPPLDDGAVVADEPNEKPPPVVDAAGAADVAVAGVDEPNEKPPPVLLPPVPELPNVNDMLTMCGERAPTALANETNLRWKLRENAAEQCCGNSSTVSAIAACAQEHSNLHHHLRFTGLTRITFRWTTVCKHMMRRKSNEKRLGGTGKRVLICTHDVADPSAALRPPEESRISADLALMSSAPSWRVHAPTSATVVSDDGPRRARLRVSNTEAAARERERFAPSASLYFSLSLSLFVTRMAEASVRVELFKREYVAGELVHGDVFLDAAIPIEFNGLAVFLVGVELMSWKEKHGNETRRKDYSKVFFNQKIGLTETPEYYELGNFFAYRFQYQLPSSLPGFVSVKQTYDSGRVSVFKGAVRYTIEARLANLVSFDDAFAGDGVLTPPATARTKLRIHALPPRGTVRALEVSVAKELRSMLFFKKGSCEITAVVDKNVFVTGTKVFVNASVHNDSSEKIEHISLQLHQHIVLMNRAKGNATYAKMICERRFPGVDAGHHSVNQLYLNLIDAAAKAPVPPTNRTGHLFVVRYIVQVECQYTGAQSVKLELPLQVVAAESGREGE
ncbi:Arrestin domain-containing protein a, partial [Globisporangium splendens]